jgi:hypothetical protein
MGTMKAGDPFMAHIVGTVDAVVEFRHGRTVAFIKNPKRSFEVVLDDEGELWAVRSYPVASGGVKDSGASSSNRYHGNLAKRTVGDGKP